MKIFITQLPNNKNIPHCNKKLSRLLFDFSVISQVLSVKQEMSVINR